MTGLMLLHAIFIFLHGIYTDVRRIYITEIIIFTFKDIMYICLASLAQDYLKSIIYFQK